MSGHGWERTGPTSARLEHSRCFECADLAFAHGAIPDEMIPNPQVTIPGADGLPVDVRTPAEAGVPLWVFP